MQTISCSNPGWLAISRRAQGSAGSIQFPQAAQGPGGMGGFMGYHAIPGSGCQLSGAW